jgi:hypothetical protein
MVKQVPLQPSMISQVNGSACLSQASIPSSSSFDPHNTQEARSRLIKYADVLNERYGHQGLSCVTVAHSRREDLSEWAGAHKITYPLIADEDGSLHERFLFGQEAGGTLIVDPDGIVRFSYHALIDADLLRQLTEKFILGQVNVAAGQIDLTVFQPGRQMPEIEALELRTGALVPLASEMVHQKMVVVFTADCATCQLNHYINQLKQLEQQLSPPSKPQATVALFSRSFSEVEVLDHLRAQEITSPVYLATNNIPGLEDPYNTRFHVTITGPLVVRLDKRGRIVNTVSIDEVLKESKDAIH